MRILLLFSLLLCAKPWLLAQSRYADSKVYFESKHEWVDIRIHKNDLKIVHEINERKHYNQAAVLDYANEYVYTRSFSEIADLKANWGIYKPNGKHQEKSITDIQLKSEMSGSVFYDDDKYYEIAFPQVNQGDYTSVSYKYILSDPHFLSGFHFTEYYPVENASFVITTDPDVEVGWIIMGEQKDQVKFSREVQEGQIVYTWSLSDVKPYVSEDNAPGYLHYATHVVPYIKNYSRNGEKVDVLNDVEDLFNWYQSLLLRIREVDDAELIRIANATTAGATSDREKAERIYYWVQDNIRYIAFEDGWRGFIPYPAQEICTKRYGDCKDMTHLMFEMMKAVGLKATHAWVGTRELPYAYEQTPCPTVDNHLVVCLELDDSVVVLDATSAHSPFGVPTSFILSKQILYKGENGYRLHRVAEYEPEDCVTRDSVVISIVDFDKKISGTAFKTLETFEYTRFHHIFGAANVDKGKFVDEYLELGQNNFELIHYDIKELEKRAKTQIEYMFEIPGYLRNFGDTYFMNLNLTRPLSDQKIPAERIMSYENEFKEMMWMTVVAKLPEGTKVQRLPDPVEVKTGVGTVTAKYHFVGNNLIYDRKVTIDRLIVSKSEFGEWNQFIGALQKVYNTSIEFN